MALTAYTRSTWKSGDILTATKLNNIESQIMNLTKVFVAENDADRYVASKSDWGIIKIANNDNFAIDNGILNFIASPSFTNITASGTINGAALTISGNSTLNGNLTITNKFLVSDAITLRLATTVSNTLSVTGAAALNGGMSTTNATVSGTLGVTGETTLGAVNARSLAVTNGITTNKATLSAAPASYAALDLIPESRLENYIGGISISAGNGLEGGGALSASRTLTAKLGANLAFDADGAIIGNYSVASTSANGLMSAEDKSKLNGIAAGADVGTITGITMNGTSKGTSGVVDLGTVITDVSEKANSADLAAVALSGNYDDLENALPIPRMAGSYYLNVSVSNDEYTYIWADMPDLPGQDGIYNLQVTVNNNVPVYTWVAVT